MNRLRFLSGLGLFCFLFLSCFNAEAKEDDERRYEMDLEKIVVTASKVEQEYKYSTQNISILSKEDVDSGGITEVTELLDLLPSVDILEYGSAGSAKGVHTRGASSSQVLTLVDGRPVNTPRDGETDFNRIPLSNIERIEVLRGPASSIYGANAVGGVINIVTKNGKEKMNTELLSKFGSFRTRLSSLTHGYKIKDFDYFISYDYLASHGHRDNADYLSNNMNTKFGYQLDKDNRISISSGFYDSEVGSPGSTGYPDPNDRQETFNKYIDFTYTGKMLDGQDLLLKIFHNSDRLEYITEDDPGEYDPIAKDTHLTKVYGVDGQISQIFFDVFRTAIGFDYSENKLNSSKNDKHTYNTKGLYFESETDLFDTGSLKLGARWDDYSSFGDRISPSASLNLWFFDKVKLHALAAKSFRIPNFNDLYWSDPYMQGNPSLGPEKAESLETGLSGYIFKKIKTDLTFFRTNFRDLLEWVPGGGFIWSPENVSSATIKGIETETELALKDRIKVNFNYTYLESENQNTQKWLIYRPRHLYKLRLIYSPLPKYEFGANAIYKTKRFTDAANTGVLERFFTINSNFSYKINDSAQILFEAKNILDRQYQEEKDYPMPGRTFYGGFKLTF